MSLPRETLLELMALADGELEGEAKHRAEKLVAESQEARRLVETMRACHADVGAWLDEALEPRLAAADGIADAVMARVEAERGEGGSVVRLADARARRASRVQVTVAAVGAALALAAGVLLYMRSDRGGQDHATVASVDIPSLDVRPPPVLPTATVAQQTARPSQGVEVDEIDSPSRGVSVFEIPIGAAAAARAGGGGGPSSVVIMVDDDKGTAK